MIPYKTYSTLLNIGPFHITAWGLMVALGILAGLWIVKKEAERKKIDADEVYSLILWAIVGGLIGSRIGWLLTEGKNAGFITALKLWDGGLIWHGVVLGGIFTIIIYTAKKKLNFWKYMDVIAVGLPLGHAIGRIGCYITGLHPGKPTNLPWAIFLDGQLRHPVALYEIILESALFLTILSLRKKENFPGYLFYIYIMGYSAIRFVLDFFRTDLAYYGLTIAQYLSIILFAVSMALLIKDKRKNPTLRI